MIHFFSRNSKETQSIGYALAKQLRPGDVLTLRGDMGAGKSEFTRGIAKGLGISGHVVSPTFTIMQAYDTGRLPLYHFDWYRLGSAEELYELSLDEYMYADGVAVVEWPGCVEEAVPKTHLQITLVFLSEEEREMIMQPMGGFRELATMDLDGVKR